MTRNDWSRLALTSALGIALSSSFVFLAALPIRYLRLTFGRKIFFLSTAASFGVLVGLGLWQWAAIYASVCLLIGCYREMEEKRFSIFLASTLTVMLTSGLNLFALFGYSKYSGLKLKALIADKAQPFVEQLQQIPRFQEASATNILWFLPSGIVITMMIVLFVSLTVSRVPMTNQQRLEMRMFKLPDWLIWAFIGSLGTTFIQGLSEWISLVSMNVLAVTLAAYFFQGLAVFNHFLDRLKIFGFWRLLAYFLVFFQMFIFISGLGILDYWFDFREQGLTGSNNQRIKKV